MYENQDCESKEVGKESEVFRTINRIDKKITSLRNTLTPIIRSYPQDVANEQIMKKEPEQSTELLKRLKSIENNLSDLSQSIEL
jgi:hypothetical protein